MIFRRLIIGLFSLAIFSVYAEQKYDVINNGQNFVKPITRIDLKMKYESGITTANGNAAIPTLRMDKVIELPEGWQFAFRMDLSYWWYRCNQHSSSSCYDSQAMGDTLLEAIAITPNFGPWLIGFGVKMLLPTAGKNLEIGNAKLQVMPTFAFGYDILAWTKGSFFVFLVRHDFDACGYANVPHIQRTYIQPTLNIQLTKKWFVSFSPELCYNWIVKGWFIPFDITIGKLINKHTVISLEYEVAMMRKYEEFRQLLEFRIGYLF